MSQYSELLFGSLEIVVNFGREPLNNSLLGQTNTKEARINQKGTSMVKDGKDFDGFQVTNLKI